MDVAELVERYPRLYHVTHADAWPSITAHGLLSTSALLDLFQIPDRERAFIEAARRPDSVVIEHPSLGRAVIRDNKPISDAQLARCLVDITPLEYYRLLNRRVFLWPTKQRLENHLTARTYRHDPQLVVTVDTAALVTRQLSALRLSAINSGATTRRPALRGPDTFVAVTDYDFAGRRKLRGAASALAEVTVEHSIPDLAHLSIETERRLPDGTRLVL